MDWQSQDQLDGTLKVLADELVGLKSQIERQAYYFEEVLARLSVAPVDKIAIPSARTESRVQPKHFVATPFLDPLLFRRIIKIRHRRAELFPHVEFADPAWEMLLDLIATKAEGKRVSVTSLCLASGVAPTTALRWIGHLLEAGLIERQEDENDGRRVFVSLTDYAVAAMVRYVEDVKGAFESFR